MFFDNFGLFGNLTYFGHDSIIDDRMVLAWGDLQLDVPGAPALLVALLSSRVGLMDKSLFARLPQDMLASVYGSLPAGPVKDTVQAHLTELTTFKAELAHIVENDLICARSTDTFVNWLQNQNKPAFHHEVVLAACMSSFKDTPSVSAYWTSCFDSAGLVAEKCKLIFTFFVQLDLSAQERVSKVKQSIVGT